LLAPAAGAPRRIHPQAEGRPVRFLIPPDTMAVKKKLE